MVELYSGGQSVDRPRAFTWQGRRHTVSEVLDQWRLPDGPGFRIRTDDGDLFELNYREADDLWEIHPLGN